MNHAPQMIPLEESTPENPAAACVAIEDGALTKVDPKDAARPKRALDIRKGAKTPSEHAQIKNFHEILRQHAACPNRKHRRALARLLPRMLARGLLVETTPAAEVLSEGEAAT